MPRHYVSTCCNSLIVQQVESGDRCEQVRLDSERRCVVTQRFERQVERAEEPFVCLRAGNEVRGVCGLLSRRIKKHA